MSNAAITATSPAARLQGLTAWERRVLRDMVARCYVEGDITADEDEEEACDVLVTRKLAKRLPYGAFAPTTAGYEAVAAAA